MTSVRTFLARHRNRKVRRWAAKIDGMIAAIAPASLAQLALRLALAVPFWRSGLGKWDGFLELNDVAVLLFTSESSFTCREVPILSRHRRRLPLWLPPPKLCCQSFWPWAWRHALPRLGSSQWPSSSSSPFGWLAHSSDLGGDGAWFDYLGRGEAVARPLAGVTGWVSKISGRSIIRSRAELDAARSVSCLMQQGLP